MDINARTVDNNSGRENNSGTGNNNMYKSAICEIISDLPEQVKAQKPLVHFITNYVTANDCANIVLALVGSPVMADDVQEVEDIVSISSALVLNMGTLSKRTVDAMIVAGKRANEIGIPIIFDPVGAGATRYRDETAQVIISQLKPAVIRGNLSEIKSISGLAANTKGVDVSENDALLSNDLGYGKRIALELSSRLNCVVAMTGPVDIVAYKGTAYFIENGHRMLSMVTGSGCMCTSLIGAYCGITNDYMKGAVAGVVTMGIAGEMAYERLTDGNMGTGSYRSFLIDAVYKISKKDILEKGRVYDG